jgi:uncharacterized protein (DUF2062 family)
VEETPPAPVKRYGPRLPKSLADVKRWLAEHHMTLMAIADTPHSIALGSAIGIFFGFTPLYSLKTLLSIAFAWIFRCSKIAAAVAVTVHDVAIFAMPAVYVAEYRLGCWIVRIPTPRKIHFGHLGFYDYVNWHAFVHFVWPALVGSLFLALPSALGAYFLVRLLVSRARAPEEAPVTSA